MGDSVRLAPKGQSFPRADYPTQGWDYSKPLKYLSAATAECPCVGTIEDQVSKLEEGKLKSTQIDGNCP